MSKEPKLKNCPFCGSKAEINRFDITVTTIITIDCTNEECGAKIPFDDLTEEELIKRWNTRYAK